MIKLSVLSRNAAADAITNLLDQGTLHAGGYIELRADPRPTTPQIPATGTALSTLQFSKPAFLSAGNGQALSNPIAIDSKVAATGKATWFRAYNCDGAVGFDGSVTGRGGGGDIELDNVNLVAGGTVALASVTLLVPESCA